MYLFGFALRVYSNAPTGFPGALCAKVVDNEIYSDVSAREPKKYILVDIQPL